MPARKLSQADLDELRDADTELLTSRPRQITRLADNGEEMTITTQAGIAAWKGISESHFHVLKRNGWTLRRGRPYEPRSNGDGGGSVSYAELNAITRVLFGRLEELERRNHELEAENAMLRRNQ